MNHTNRNSFFKHTNIYEVNLRQYSHEGTIRGFMNHLPRLKDMGVEILWIMPIHPIGLVNRKGTLGSYYSVKDFKEINPEFGTKQDFKALVEAAHANGMKIIIDWVANHAAWDNVWTITNPDFFIRSGEGDFISPYDWSDVIQLDHSHKGEQEAMLEAMEFWVREFNIDGFRADLAHLNPLVFWVNAREVLSRIKQDLIWLAETEDIDYYQAFDINYAWKWMHAAEGFIKNNDDAHTIQAFLSRQSMEIPEGKCQMYFTSNHDENSWTGTEYEKYGSHVKALTVFNYTYPGAVPLIYSGQEIPNLKRLSFFDKDPLVWMKNIELHLFYKTLAEFRKNNVDSTNARFFETHVNMIGYSYPATSNDCIVFINFSREEVVADFYDAAINNNYKNVFNGQTIFLSGDIHFKLAPGEFLLLQAVR